MEFKKYLAGILSVAVLSSVSLAAGSYDKTSEDGDKIVREAARVLGVSERTFENAVRDEVVAYAVIPGKAKTFWREYRKPIVIGAAALVVSCGGFYGGKALNLWGSESTSTDPEKAVNGDKEVDHDSIIKKLNAEIKATKGRSKEAIAKRKEIRSELAKAKAAKAKAAKADAAKADAKKIEDVKAKTSDNESSDGDTGSEEGEEQEGEE